MPTIRNKKREPLTEEQVKQLFPNGVAILACDDGICLICKRDPDYDQVVILFGGEDSADKKAEQWWANLQGLLKGKFITHPTMKEREPLENKVNKQLLGLEIRYTLGL